MSNQFLPGPSVRFGCFGALTDRVFWAPECTGFESGAGCWCRFLVGPAPRVGELERGLGDLRGLGAQRLNKKRGRRILSSAHKSKSEVHLLCVTKDRKHPDAAAGHVA